MENEQPFPFPVADFMKHFSVPSVQARLTLSCVSYHVSSRYTMRYNALRLTTRLAARIVSKYWQRQVRIRGVSIITFLPSYTRNLRTLKCRTIVSVGKRQRKHTGTPLPLKVATPLCSRILQVTAGYGKGEISLPLFLKQYLPTYHQETKIEL